METLTKHQQEIIKSFCEENDIKISKTYSGRGMYGKQCFGLDVASGQSPTTLVAMLIDSALGDYFEGPMSKDNDLYVLREFIGLFTEHEMKQDNLGKGMIYYFPSLQWGDDSQEEGDGDPLDEDVALELLKETRDAYSFDRFGEDEWLKAIKLLWLKYQDHFVVEEVLKSKWTRWCEYPTGQHLIDFINDPKNGCKVEDLIG